MIPERTTKMRTTNSIMDWMDARASLPSLLSDIAFGSGPVAASASRAAAALAMERPTYPNRVAAR
jgi:hypothetical protein